MLPIFIFKNHLLVANQNILEEKHIDVFCIIKSVDKENIMGLGRAKGSILPKGGRTFLNADKRPV